MKKYFLAGLLLLGVPSASFATLTVGEQGLTSQSFGTQTIAAPGDVGEFSNFGVAAEFKRTVVGPKIDAYTFTLTTTQGFLDNTYTCKKVDDHSWSVTVGAITAIVTRNDTWRINVTHGGVEIAIFDAPLVDFSAPPLTGWVFNTTNSALVTGGVVTNFAATWPVGWAAMNHRTPAFQRWLIGASSSTANRGMISAWYNLNHDAGDDGSNGLGYLIELRSHPANAEDVFVQYSTVTAQLSLFSTNSRFVAQNNIKAVPRNAWFWLGLGYELSGTTASLTLIYRECTPGYFNSSGTITAGSCGATQTLATVTSYNQFGQVFNAAGTGWWYANGSKLNMRLGLPTLYTMDSMSDVAYPNDIYPPPAGPNEWYVNAASTGGGKGYSVAEAWTGTEFSSFTAIKEYTVLGGTVANPVNGALVDVTKLSIDTILQKYEDGLLAPMGDRINFNDAGGPIYLCQGATTQSNISYSDNVRLQPIAGLGHKADLRATALIAASAWGPVGSNVYVSTITNEFGVLFEYDSVADSTSTADSLARLMVHPSVQTLTMYKSSATAGSFWSDGGGGNGTHVYVRPTGDADPRSSGKVYELSRQNNAIVFDQKGVFVKDLKIRFPMAVDTSNTDTLSVGVSLKVQSADELLVYDNLILDYGGKHNFNVAESGQNHMRLLVLNSTYNYGRPNSFAPQGQSLEVIDQNTDLLDSQAYFKNDRTWANVINEGQKLGAVDTNVSIYLEHNGGNAARPIAKQRFIGVVVPGVSAIGGCTQDLVVTDCVFGSSDSISVTGFQGLTNTIERNIFYTRYMPPFGGYPNSTSLVRSNKFFVRGSQVNVANSTGAIKLINNTIDCSSCTAGIAGATIFNDGGLVGQTTWYLIGNNIILPAGVELPIFDVIVTTRGDVLVEGFNIIQGTSSNKTLITNYNGSSKTLAGLRTAGVEISSSSSVTANLDLEIGGGSLSYAPHVASPAHNAVWISSAAPFDTDIQSSLDFKKDTRPSAGLTDAGCCSLESGVDAMIRRRRR